MLTCKVTRLGTDISSTWLVRTIEHPGSGHPQMDIGILVSKLNNHRFVEIFADADNLTHSLSRQMQDSRSFSKPS